MNLAMERESVVAIVSLQESKFLLFKYEKMGKGICLYYKITVVNLYSLGMFEGSAGAGTANWIGILPIFARPKRVQLSIGAVKVK